METTKKTYFVPFFNTSEDGQYIIGNMAIESEKRGKDLIVDVITRVTARNPGATVLGIQEV